jgi:tetratricopeptide (TPR) repeat protein
MRAAAERAVQLDPLLPEAHDALGLALARSGEWERAEQSFRRAINLDPFNSGAHDHLAFFTLYPLGRIDEALRHLAIAQQSDPLSSDIHVHTSDVLFAASRFLEAAVHCERLPKDSWANTECVSRVLLGLGRAAEAIGVLETTYRRGIPAGNDLRGYLGYAYALAGRREDAEHLAETMPPLNPFNVAVIFAGLGDKDRCFAALDRATSAGPYRIGWALASPEFANTRGDSRVVVLRNKVGLPQ